MGYYKRNIILIVTTLFLLLLLVLPLVGVKLIIAQGNEKNFESLKHLKNTPFGTKHEYFENFTEFEDLELSNTRITSLFYDNCLQDNGGNWTGICERYYLEVNDEYLVVVQLFEEPSPLQGYGQVQICRYSDRPVGINFVIGAAMERVTLYNDSDGDGKVDFQIDEDKFKLPWERISETGYDHRIDWWLSGNLDFFLTHPECDDFGWVRNAITNFYHENWCSVIENDTTVLHFGWGATVLYDHAGDGFQTPEEISKFDYLLRWSIQAKSDSPSLDVKFDLILENFSIAASQIPNFKSPLLASYWHNPANAVLWNGLFIIFLQAQWQVEGYDLRNKPCVLENINMSHLEQEGLYLSDLSLGYNYLLNNSIECSITNIVAVLNDQQYIEGIFWTPLYLNQIYDDWTLNDAVYLDPLIRCFFLKENKISILILLPIIGIPVGIMMSYFTVIAHRKPQVVT